MQLLTAIVLLAGTLAFENQLAGSPFIPATQGPWDPIAFLHQETNELRSNLRELKTQQDAMAEKVAWAQWSVAAGAAVVLVGGFLGIPRLINRHLRRFVEETLRDRANQMLAEASKRYETEALRYSEGFALFAQKRYVECLDAFGWDKQPASLPGLPVAVRRSIIESLYRAKEKRGKTFEAWQAAKELFTDAPSIESLRLVLRLAIAVQEPEAGMRLYKSFNADPLKDRSSDTSAATLLRALGKTQEAIDLIRRHISDSDCSTLNTYASLLRDSCKANEATKVMRPRVEQIIASEGAPLPDSWQHLFNSYIASWRDQGKPNEAAAAACFLLRRDVHHITVFVCTRLAKDLPADSSERTFLVARAKEIVTNPPQKQDYAAAAATIKWIEGDLDGAIRVLESHVQELKKERASNRDHKDLYYAECYLGVLLRESWRLAPNSGVEKLNRSKDILRQAAADNATEGEAFYELAVLAALQEDRPEVIRELKIAIERQPRRRMLIESDERLIKIPEVQRLLAASALDQQFSSMPPPT